MVKFEKGKVVILNSGGPDMVMKGEVGLDSGITIAEPGDIICEWIDDKGKVQSAYFAPEMLKWK